MSDPTAAAGTQSAPSGPQLSYDVPQEVSYSADSYIVLQIDPAWFIASAAAGGGVSSS